MFLCLVGLLVRLGLCLSWFLLVYGYGVILSKFLVLGWFCSIGWFLIYNGRWGGFGVWFFYG